MMIVLYKAGTDDLNLSLESLYIQLQTNREGDTDKGRVRQRQAVISAAKNNHKHAHSATQRLYTQSRPESIPRIFTHCVQRIMDDSSSGEGVFDTPFPFPSLCPFHASIRLFPFPIRLPPLPPRSVAAIDRSSDFAEGL